MGQKHDLSTIWEDQGIAPPTYSYVAPKHLHIDITKASHLESNYLCSLGAKIVLNNITVQPLCNK